MKKPSNRDLALLGIALVLGALIGWCLKGMADSTKPPITIESPINEALKKRSDSLEAVVVQRDLRIAKNEKQQFVHDSIIIANNKDLKPLYDKIIKLDDSTRAVFIDERLKRAGIRR